MTREDWNEMELYLLSGIYRCVFLKIDGQEVTVRAVRSGMRIKLFVMIEGTDVFDLLTKQDAELNEKELEIRNKFFCKKTKRMFKSKDLENSKLSKKQKMELSKHKYSYYSPYYNSFKTLKNTFSRNCKQIERVFS